MFQKKEKKYLVKDYMQTNVKTVVSTTSLRAAVSTMIKEKTNGLVVIDKNAKVVGILSSWDIIQHIVPDYLEHEKSRLAGFEAAEVLCERVRDVKDDIVENFMTKKVHCVRNEDNLMEVVTMLSQFHIRQMPVVDDDKRLIGYINRTDIKKAIFDILETQDE